MMEFRENSKVCATVVNIQWERIHLYIDLEITGLDSSERLETFDFFAVNDHGGVGILFDTEIISENRIKLYVNITNNGKHECVRTGTYRILACKGQEIYTECETAPGLTLKLQDLSRAYLYSGQNKAYDVIFYVNQDSETLPFRMRVVNLASTNLDFPQTANFSKKIKGAVKDCISNPRANIRRLYKAEYNANKAKRKNHILFMTEQSAVLGSNLTSIIKRMKERGLDKKYTISTWARKMSDKNHGTANWMQLIKLLASNEMIFIDDHVPILDWLKLTDDTTLIQTWHAGAGFKSSGYSRWGHMGCPAPQSCHRQYSYGLCGSKKIAHFFSEVWGINTERVLNTGMPRMDEYQDEKYMEKTKKKLYELFPLCKGKKVILFAPTYRGKNNSDAYYPYELIDWKRLNEVCGNEYVVLFKMHPWVIKNIEIPEEYRSKMIDVKTYPNINDLFYFTDILITDYSSNIYEYSLMRKPMLFFAYDEIQYSFSRGFHRPYKESAPGKVCATFEELMKAIENRDFEFEKVENYVKTQFDHFDSNACDRVIDWLILGKMPEEIKRDIAAREKRISRMDEAEFPNFALERMLKQTGDPV